MEQSTSSKLRLSPIENQNPSAMIDAQPNEKFRLGHRIWLDVLRGIAVLLVILHHFSLIKNGAIGVDIFFVLSGFLITSILLEEFYRKGAISLKNFYLRRMCRLLPLLYFVVACYLLIAVFCFSQSGLKSALYEAFAVGSYSVNLRHLHGIEYGSLGFTWSLCVEEHFYLLWPLLLVGLLKLKVSRRITLGLLISGITVIAWWRAHLYNLHVPGSADPVLAWFRIYTGTDTRTDSLLVGCILGLIAAWNCLPKSRKGLVRLKAAGIICSIGIAYCVVDVSPACSDLMKGLYTGIAAMVAVTMAWMLVDPPKYLSQKTTFTRVFAALGKISYGLYLFHLPVKDLLSWFFLKYSILPAQFGWSAPIQTTLAIAISVGLAVICYALIERPFLQLKRRFESGKEPAGKLRVATTEAAVESTFKQAA